MSDKNLYINDLKHRYPEHTFEEIPVSSMTRVIFRDEDSNIIGEVKKLDPIDAYRSIRSDLLGWKNPVFLSSSAEMDALSNIDMGTFIEDMDTGLIKFFDGSSWKVPGGAASYGEMWQDNNSGKVIPASGVWDTAQAGALDSNGNITYSDSKLTVGALGAGDYSMSFNANFISASGEICSAYFHIGGVDVEKIKDTHPGDSAERGDLSASGIVTLSDGDDIELHLQSESAVDTIKVYQVNVNIRRIS